MEMITMSLERQIGIVILCYLLSFYLFGGFSGV